MSSTMFVIRCILILVIFIFEQIPHLVSTRATEGTDILKAESDIRKTANSLFYSLGLRKIQEKQKLHQYALAHNYFISLTIQDYFKLQEIAEMTRTDKEHKQNGSADLIALITEIQNEDNVLKLQNMKLGEDARTRYDDTGEMVKLEYLKMYHEQQFYNKSMERNKVLLERLQDEESLELDNITKTNAHNDNDSDIQFWNETEELPERRMYNGKRAKIKKFPFMASVQLFGRFTCGGCIIQSDLVITAASCLQLAWNNRFYRENPKFLSVRVGSSFYEVGGESIDVLEVYFHPSYNPKTLRHNLVLMRLVRKIRLRKRSVKKIQIGGEISQNSGRILTAGWGARTIGNTLHSPFEDKLRFVELDLYGLEDCQDIYSKEYVTRQNFCGGFISRGTGACNRDVGGPGIMSGMLVGIISFGAPACGTPDTPTVFTSLAYYRDWIEEIMEQRVLSIKKLTTLKPPKYNYQPPTWTFQQSWDVTPVLTQQPRGFASQTVGSPAVNLHKGYKLRDNKVHVSQDYSNIKFGEDNTENSLLQGPKRVTKMDPALMINHDRYRYLFEDESDGQLLTTRMDVNDRLESDADEGINYNLQDNADETELHEGHEKSQNQEKIIKLNEFQEDTTPMFDQVQPSKIKSHKSKLSKVTKEEIKKHLLKVLEPKINYFEISTESKDKEEKELSAHIRSQANYTASILANFNKEPRNLILNKSLLHYNLPNNEEFKEPLIQGPNEPKIPNYINQKSENEIKFPLPEILKNIQNFVTKEPNLAKPNDMALEKINYNFTQVQEATNLAYNELLEYEKLLAKALKKNNNSTNQQEFSIELQPKVEPNDHVLSARERTILNNKEWPTQENKNAALGVIEYPKQALDEAKVNDEILQKQNEETPNTFKVDIFGQIQEQTNTEYEKTPTNGLKNVQQRNQEHFSQDLEMAPINPTIDQEGTNQDRQYILVKDNEEITLVTKEYLREEQESVGLHQEELTNADVKTAEINQEKELATIQEEKLAKLTELQPEQDKSRIDDPLDVMPQAKELTELAKQEDENLANYDEAPGENLTQDQELIYQQLMAYQEAIKSSKQNTKDIKNYKLINQDITSEIFRNIRNSEHQVQEEIENKAKPVYQNINLTPIKGTTKAYITFSTQDPKVTNLMHTQNNRKTPQVFYLIESRKPEQNRKNTTKSKESNKIRHKQRRAQKSGFPHLLDQIKTDPKIFLKRKIDDAIVSLLDAPNNVNQSIKNTSKNVVKYVERAQSLQNESILNSNEKSRNPNMHFIKNSVFESKDIDKLISLFRATSKIKRTFRSNQSESSIFDRYNEFLKGYADALEKSKISGNNTAVIARRSMNGVHNDTAVLIEEDNAIEKSQHRSNETAVNARRAVHDIHNDTLVINKTKREEEDNVSNETTNIDTNEAEIIKRNVLDYINI